MDFRIFPPEEVIETHVALPLSKSMSNRALAIAALTPGGVAAERMADCADTRAMAAAISQAEGRIDIGAAGTAMRFLTAVMASTPGRNVTIDGSERMRHRPIGPLVEALRECGAQITYLAGEGFPPLQIEGSGLRGGEVTMDASTSSQFVSALLMAAPTMERGLRLTLAGETVSEPYIDMTIGMMRRAGASVTRDGNVITVDSGSYRPVAQEIEADWSAASYWYEIQALSSGFISLDRLAKESLQGDRACAEIFSHFGVVTDFDGEGGMTDLTASPDMTPRLHLDMSATPDLVQTVVVTCCLLGVPFRLTGLSTLRIKETDRIGALCREMLKIGVALSVEGDDEMWWEGARVAVTELPVFDTYDDHRMAMALAPAALFIPGIVVRDTEVVDKSYPGYWDDLRAAGFTLEEAER